MANSAGEMPFLDHLEELRKRILLALAGVVVGLGIGWLATTRFDLIKKLEVPIAPFIPGGKLTVLTPIAPFMIYLKFAMVLGLVLSSPWVLYQLWAFLAPALTRREKKAILPALGIGLVLFLAGAAIGWHYVLPPTIKWLLTFEQGTFITQITYDSYLELVIHLLVAMGISAELPLVMILLASLGLLSYRVYKRFRRYAFFLSFIGGAILSPTPEVVSMILFTLPLLMLYEVGMAGAYIVERRKLRAARAVAAGAVLLALAVPHGVHAQFPRPVPAPVQGVPGRADTGRRGVTGQGLRSIDSSTAKRLGLPAGPTRVFPGPDSVMQALLSREGFAATRFIADSASFNVDDQRILLSGRAATDRDASILEADRIIYDDGRCEVVAEGEPRMFEPGQAALIGITMRFNTCNERGLIGEAYTSFNELGANWFVRGNLAVDSSAKRLYAAHSEFTSCDLPEPHYHFVAGQVKWVSQSIIVARPAVLFIRDVPVAWLPFIFQDTKSGRASGILIPRFGFNDIVRPTRTYNRQLTDLGYYWAPNDYIDATARFDWYANRNTQYTGQFNYRWLDRFVQGGISVTDLIQTDGATTKTVSWQHRQEFNVTTSINLNFNYASNSSVLQNNAIDPSLSTRGIYSQLTLQKRFRWGQVSVGGTRNQSLSDGSGTMTLPSLTVSPSAVALGKHITWSPSFSAHNDMAFGTPLTAFSVSETGTDTIKSTGHARLTVVTLTTPLELFGLTWSNSLQYQDRQVVGPTSVTQRVPNTSTADTTDSVSVTTFRGGDFQSTLDWSTAVSLPSLFRSTWKVTPSIGVSNVAAGAFVLRSPGTNGNWVVQRKKVAFDLQSVPSFYGFINRGLGPYQRFRYEFAPFMSLKWSPAASVSQAYARALGATGTQAQVDVPALMQASVSLHQTFVGKMRPLASDTNTDPIHLTSLPKKQIFSISTSGISYDFEQAKLPHRTGWTTQALTNSFQSDLLQGFTVSTTHDLWQGAVGTDTARFSPFLSQVQASFSLTGHTFHTIAGVLGLVRHDTVTATGPALGTSSPLAAASAMSMLRPGASALQGLPRRGFNASVTYMLSRQRATGPTAQPVTTDPTGIGSPLDPIGTLPLVPIIAPPAASSIGLTMSFSPTAFWTVSWNTLYDITKGTFEQQTIQLQRDLHDWRASFNFVKNVNGNFALYFSVFLLNLPDVKFDYNQTTLQQTTLAP